MGILYKFHGIVQKGKQRGKTLGFPTINIPLSQDIPEGIYYSFAIVNDCLFPALTMIGTAKTFQETMYHSETYILNFDKQVYGCDIKIQLLKKFRDNRKFKTIEDLISAMNEDKKKAKLFFRMG